MTSLRTNTGGITMKDTKNIINTINNWHELLECARTEYIFGAALDKKLYKKCMEEAFEHFFVNNRVHENDDTSFDKLSVNLYGLIFAYSQIPAVTDTDDTLLFEASTRAARGLANAILHPETITIDNYKLIDDNYVIDNKFRAFTYDFKSGDLKDYMELVELEYGE